MKWFVIAIIPLLLWSCGGNERPVYQGAEYYKNLEVPPDLTEPDTAGQLRVPDPTEEAQQRFRDNNKLETVITPKFDGVRMVNYAGNSWLEIDNNVEHVWPRLRDFWQLEGVELVEDRPSLGFMETAWVQRLEADTGYFRSMFQKFEPDVKDKYRVRLERFDDDNKTRLFIAHTSIERILYGEESDAFIWQSRPSDIEAEREIISRMALFAGKNQQETGQLLDNYRPYSSLVKVDSTNATALTMTGSMDFVWHRALRALDRMLVQDIRQQKDSSTIYFVVGKRTKEELLVEEDELAKSSWLMQLFSSSDEKGSSTNKQNAYRLEFTDVDGRIQIDVKDAADTRNVDEDEAVNGTALAEQLRDILVGKLE
ncbi:MAG: outer membrane protein assembly factor BamC [Gammaproteobacteria bacterium]|nr:outer membrane protein assembly factor BamC [Gammaproteobacteria bacterium]